MPKDPERMNAMLALLLQADDLGKKPPTHTPGVAAGFSRVMIIVFIMTLAVAAAWALWMVVRGAAGAARAKMQKEGEK